MAGHSRSKNGVASLAYVPAIHVFALADAVKTRMPGTRVYTWAGRRPDPGAGHDGVCFDLFRCRRVAIFRLVVVHECGRGTKRPRWAQREHICLLRPLGQVHAQEWEVHMAFAALDTSQN